MPKAKANTLVNFFARHPPISTDRWPDCPLSARASLKKFLQSPDGQYNARGEPFQYRERVEESPGGHRIRSFVGNGTIFKQLSRPVRHVNFIGTREQQQTGRGWRM